MKGRTLDQKKNYILRKSSLLDHPSGIKKKAKDIKYSTRICVYYESNAKFIDPTPAKKKSSLILF